MSFEAELSDVSHALLGVVWSQMDRVTLAPSSPQMTYLKFQCCYRHTRAVKMAEKLNSNFVLKYDHKFELYSNLKGIISSYLLGSQEGASSKILLKHGSSKHKITRLLLKNVHNV